MEHPTLSAFPIADAAPVLVFGDDLDRQAGTRIDPVDVVLLRRARPHVDALGLEADEARQRESTRAVGTFRTRRIHGRAGERPNR